MNRFPFSFVNTASDSDSEGRITERNHLCWVEKGNVIMTMTTYNHSFLMISYHHFALYIAPTMTLKKCTQYPSAVSHHSNELCSRAPHLVPPTASTKINGVQTPNQHRGPPFFLHWTEKGDGSESMTSIFSVGYMFRRSFVERLSYLI